MVQLVWCFFVALALAEGPAIQAAQSELSDSEVARGVRQVEEGDYDAGILSLDRAARRLANDPDQARTLSQAYLYLGIAYVGKGLEEEAKAHFREAITHTGDLTLNPSEFPPKVIDLFEAAKEEAAKEEAAAPVAEAPPPPSQAPVPVEEGGGSNLPLILAGVGGGGAAGALLLASGGDDSGGGGEPFDPGGPSTVTQPFAGVLNEDNVCVEHYTEAGGQGAWQADVRWTQNSFVWIEVYTEDFELISEGRMLSPTTAFADWDGCCRFKIELCWVVEENPNPPGHYELTVTFPRP
jgi:hypothetical protein